MRLQSLNNVTSGIILAKDIYGPDGTILLSKGVVLTNHFIKRLYELGVYDIYIEDEISKDIEIPDIIDQRTRVIAKQTIQQVMKDLKVKKSFDFSPVQQVVNRIVDELLDNRDIVINLSDLRCVDEYTFSHSVNVAVLSMVIGKSLGYNEMKLRDLGIGAILHDIGKTQTPNEVLNKPGTLTLEEMEIIKKHPVHGYEILKEYEDVSGFSRIISLFHHERMDGSGYPLGRKGHDIPELARIVAITDTYDAMTSNRVYRKKLTPDKAVEFLETTGNLYYDHEIVKAFLNHIAIYPIGTIVKMSTGQKGIVIDNNRHCPTRPVIRLVENEHGKRLLEFDEIDLQKRLNICIVEVCDE